MKKPGSIFALDSLVETGRAARPPLVAWAEGLLERLRTSETWDPAGRGEVGRCMNNAALIQAFRGDHAGAKTLCELQLEWLADLGRVHGRGSVIDLATQPWINLGRLLRMQGQSAASRPYFSLILDAQAGRELVLGSIRAALQEGSGLPRVLEAVYYLDTAKSYFATADFEGALDFLWHGRTQVPTESVLPHEAEFLALASLGRCGEALAVTDRSQWMRSAYARLLRMTYRVGLVAAEGELARARSAVSMLKSKAFASGLLEDSDTRISRYLQSLGRVTAALEVPEIASEIWEKGLEVSRRIGDMPLELDFVENLLRCDAVAASRRRELERDRAALLGGCLYASILHRRACSADPVLAASAVFDALRERLTRIARRARRNAGAPVAA